MADIATVGKDLAQHISETQTSYTWFWRIGLTTLIAMVAFLLKWLIGRATKKIDGIVEWKENFLEEARKKGGFFYTDETRKAGGLVYRDDHFDWCGKSQEKCSEEVKCRICDLEEWRDAMLQKGGPLLIQDYIAMSEKLQDRLAFAFKEGIEVAMQHHREWVDGRLQVIQVTLQKDVLEELRKLSSKKTS